MKANATLFLLPLFTDLKSSEDFEEKCNKS